MDATVIAISIVAVFFAGMGGYALVAPSRLIAPFDIALNSVTARSEVRAVYGGSVWRSRVFSAPRLSPPVFARVSS